MRKLILAAAVLPVLALPTLAQAGTAEDISTCRAALAADAADKVDSPEFKFKGVKGSNLRRITFEEKTTATKVVCKIKRGDVVALEWAS